MDIQFISYGADIKDFFRGHSHDVGIDVRAFYDDITIQPGETVAGALGFGLVLPAGYMALLLPRSSAAARGLVSQLAPIDPGYTGEWHYSLFNGSKEPITVKKGERFAQIVVTPVIYVNPVKDLGTERGSNGLGSTKRM